MLDFVSLKATVLTPLSASPEKQGGLSKTAPPLASLCLQGLTLGGKPRMKKNTQPPYHLWMLILYLPLCPPDSPVSFVLLRCSSLKSSRHPYWVSIACSEGMLMYHNHITVPLRGQIVARCYLQHWAFFFVFCTRPSTAETAIKK